MDAEFRQEVTISRVFDAPRELVYRAFTDPDHLAAWWGPIGCSLPRELIEVDNRPGGFQRFVMVVADDASHPASSTWPTSSRSWRAGSSPAPCT